MIAGIAIIFPLWAMLTIFNPKSLMLRYFKELHFTLTEIYMLKEFPGSFARTGIFGWTLLLSPYGFRTSRDLHTIRDAMSTWYAYALRFLMVYNMFTIISIVILFAILFYTPFQKTPVQ